MNQDAFYMKETKRFEAWLSEQLIEQGQVELLNKASGVRIFKKVNGNYTNNYTQGMWTAWYHAVKPMINAMSMMKHGELTQDSKTLEHPLLTETNETMKALNKCRDRLRELESKILA